MDSTAFLEKIEALGGEFARRAPENDSGDAFVTANYAALKDARVFSALVPEDLGGLGISHSVMCRALRILGRHCGSTALALSMHSHVTATQVFNHRAGKPTRPLLERIAKEQLVLFTTGANDWLASSGKAEKVEGGFAITARKAFSSGSPAGDLLLTSAPYLDPAEGWQVLHFAVPAKAPGLRIIEDWKTMGMRGTGSNSISLESVFIPDAGIALRRPRGSFHPFFAVIVTLACPLIVSAYVGVAEAAAASARGNARKRPTESALPFLLGELENHLTAAQIAVDSMVALANDGVFAPSVELANQVLVRKTLGVNAALAAGEKALEASGGSGFYRSSGLERMVRDLHAGQFHPLQEKRQVLFSGRIALGLDPVEPAVFPSDV
jgi:alkylation response protein AidB-like acyl-CoA dehydrogenase